jgi:hypothetical protein
MGTESPDLPLKEYQLIHQGLALRSEAVRQAGRGLAQAGCLFAGGAGSIYCSTRLGDLGGGGNGYHISWPLAFVRGIGGAGHRAAEADRFLEQLRERLGVVGLELHPDKKHQLKFGRFAGQYWKRRGQGKLEMFNFLGFAHISGKTRAGRFAVKRKAVGQRMRTKLEPTKRQLLYAEAPRGAQTGKWLRSVVQGDFNYHAVPGNLDRLGVFRERVTGLWRRTLRDRIRTGRRTWTRMYRLVLPGIHQPRVLHPHPEDRFPLRHLTQEPYALLSTRTELPWGC